MKHNYFPLSKKTRNFLLQKLERSKDIFLTPYFCLKIVLASFSFCYFDHMERNFIDIICTANDEKLLQPKTLFPTENFNKIDPLLTDSG